MTVATSDVVDHSSTASEPAGAADTGLARSERAEIRALLIAAVLLRSGVVAATSAVIFYVNDLNGGRPSNVVIGVIGAAQAIPEMLFAFFLARLADRFGRRRFLIGGPLLGAAGCLLVTAATHPMQFVGARLLEGVGAAAFVPTALGTIAAETSHSAAARARASSAFEGSTLGGYAVGFLVGPFAYHWLHRGAFPLLACMYITAAVICWRFVPHVVPLAPSPVGHVLRAIVGRGPIRAFIPAWLAVNGLVGGWYYNMPALLKRRPEGGQTLVHGFDERLIGAFELAFVVALLVGIALWTPHLRRLGGVASMRRAVPAALVVCAGLFAINHLPLALAPAVLPIVAVAVAWEGGFGPAAVAYLADCSENLASDRSALMAFYTVTLAGGGALGAVLGGLFAKWLLFDGVLLLGVVLALVAMRSLAAVAAWERQHGSETVAEAPSGSG